MSKTTNETAKIETALKSQFPVLGLAKLTGLWWSFLPLFPTDPLGRLADRIRRVEGRETHGTIDSTFALVISLVIAWGPISIWMEVTKLSNLLLTVVLAVCAISAGLLGLAVAGPGTSLLKEQAQNEPDLIPHFFAPFVWAFVLTSVAALLAVLFATPLGTYNLPIPDAAVRLLRTLFIYLILMGVLSVRHLISFVLTVFVGGLMRKPSSGKVEGAKSD